MFAKLSEDNCLHMTKGHVLIRFNQAWFKTWQYCKQPQSIRNQTFCNSINEKENPGSFYDFEFWSKITHSSNSLGSFQIVRSSFHLANFAKDICHLNPRAQRRLCWFLQLISAIKLIYDLCLMLWSREGLIKSQTFQNQVISPEMKGIWLIVTTINCDASTF